MKQLFKDDWLNAEFEKQGFVKIPFLNKQELFALCQIFETDCNYPTGIVDSGMYFSLLSNSAEATAAVKQKVKQVFLPAYERVFINYRSIAESFLAKTPDKEADLMLHQDWNYVDENEFAAATLWAPLTDVKVFNGAMYCIPQSHRFFKGLRSSAYSTARIKNGDELKPYLQAIELTAGEALVFKQALWHGSYPNLSNQLRVIATSILLQQDAPFVYSVKSTNEGEADIYELSDDAFLKELNTLSGGAVPQAGKLLRKLAYQHYIPEAKELIAKAAQALAEKPLA